MANKLPLTLGVLSVGALAAVYLWNLGGEPPQGEPPQGRACFELHLPVLPPGTQYEGARAVGERIRIKVMTGVDLRELECLMDAEGELQPARGQ